MVNMQMRGYYNRVGANKSCIWSPATQLIMWFSCAVWSAIPSLLYSDTETAPFTGSNSEQKRSCWESVSTMTHETVKLWVIFWFCTKKFFHIMFYKPIQRYVPTFGKYKQCPARMFPIWQSDFIWVCEGAIHCSRRGVVVEDFGKNPGTTTRQIIIPLTHFHLSKIW